MTDAKAMLAALAYISAVTVTFIAALSWSRRRDLVRWLRSPDGRRSTIVFSGSWLVSTLGLVTLMDWSWEHLLLAFGGSFPFALGVATIVVGIRIIRVDEHGDGGGGGSPRT